ncbi:MAG: hypothetical protein WC496_01195 [Phycisphaerae bacterium]|jgi:hypothetical protein
MKTIKYILVLIVLAAVISLTAPDAIARSHHGHSSFSIGIGFGYPYPDPYWYGPHHRYYNWGFYGYPYYPYNYYDVVERPVVVKRPPIVITQAAPVQTYSPPPERLVDGRLKEANPVSNPNVTVWVINDNGSKTSVTLRPQGTGFVGPSNEYYSAMPTEDQLKALYGLKSNTPPADKNSVVVWINNSDGSKTPITLHKEGSNYIGPAGEKYTSLPTGEQLKALYGENSSANQTEFNFEIIKADGTKVAVTIKKDGTEFVGPKGERYPSMPTEEQLRLIYGK